MREESSGPRPRSVGWSTAIDVLPLDTVVERRDGYLVVRSPSNPRHYWGNLLLFDDPPRDGDGPRWEALFAKSFGEQSSVRHRTFAWDRTDSDIGAARGEFVDQGYDLDETVALVAHAAQLQPHARQSSEVAVRSLDSTVGADMELWDAVVEIQVQGRDAGHDEDTFRTFSRRRLDGLRALFRTGRGAWYVALDHTTGMVVGSCGIVATAGRGRFQVVDTALAFRGRGICSRLVVEAARLSAAEYGVARFVIVADLHYHALGLYESLGFERAEQLAGVCCWPRADAMVAS
jgi:Acetyltransferase (GNAT) domain